MQLHDVRGAMGGQPGRDTVAVDAEPAARPGGAPRGVRQHHGAILCNVAGAADILISDFDLSDDERFLSFLPLSHAYEHTGGQFLPISVGAQIHYAEGLEKLASNIEETSPTVMVVVPRLFEVLRTRIMKQIAKQGGAASFLMDRALEIEERAGEKGRKRLRDRPMDLLVGRLLRPKIRARFGGRLKAMVSGGAPLNPEVGTFFQALGLPMMQGYGQTEAGPVISCNRPSAGVSMDTVGPPMKGVEIRIAEDGEILCRGELVMHGYWQNQPETDRALQDGWLHTGDVGEWRDGQLKIVDRLKDIMITAGGKNLSPTEIENTIKASPYIKECIVIGEARKYVSALIQIDFDTVAKWAEQERIAYTTFRSLTEQPQVNDLIQAEVNKGNEQLPQVAQIKRFHLLTKELDHDDDEVTATMKVRRSNIYEKYTEVIESLYA